MSTDLLAGAKIGRSGAFGALVVGLLLLSDATFAAPLVAIDLDPDLPGVQAERELTLGAPFVIEVRVTGVELGAPLQGFELDLDFDAAALLPTAVFDGGFLLVPVLGVELELGAPDVNFAEISLAPGGATGDGILARIAFSAVGAGTTVLDLNDVILTAPFGVQIDLAGVSDATVHVLAAPEPSVGALIALAFGLCLGLRSALRWRWSAALLGFLAAACGPDVNNDGVVNILDVSLVASCRGHDPLLDGRCATSDTNYDGIVDRIDLDFVIAAFNETRPVQRAPVLSGLQAPATLGVAESGAITFDYADPDADIARVNRTRLNALGSRDTSTAAAEAGIAGASGRVTLPLEGGALALGANSFTFELEDSGGRRSAPQTVTVTLVGVGSGVAPVVTAFAPLPLFEVITRPGAQTYSPGGVGLRSRVRARFTLGFADPDADLARVRGVVHRPDGTTSAAEPMAAPLGLSGAAGEAIVELLSFSSEAPLGTYRFELTLFDRAGNASETAQATLELVASGGTTQPFVTAVLPASGSAGDLVQLLGFGFARGFAPSENRVTLSQREAEVVSADALSIWVRVPEAAGSGRWVVKNPLGVALGPGVFTVPARVTVSPDDAQVAVGGTRLFHARVVSHFERRVAWSVDGVPGGDDAVGRIDALGQYRAPAVPPPAGVVEISASPLDDDSIAGSATVEILPPPASAGSALVLGSLGARVPGALGAAELVIPAGAFGGAARIQVEELFGPTGPAPEPGRELLGAVRLGPDGQAFSSPVLVRVPLSRSFAPGTELAAGVLLPASGALDRSEGLVATVLENGTQAEVEVSHFTDFVLDGPAQTGSASAPRINALWPLSGQEGLSVPVRFRGENLDGDLRLEIRRAGQGALTSDIAPGALVQSADGSEAGAVLRIQTIPGLDGGGRLYTLRLVRVSNGEWSEADFSVIGLPELVVPERELVELPAGLQRYSSVFIGADSIVRANDSVLHVNGPVTIDQGARLMADGENGASAQHKDGADFGGTEYFSSGGDGALGEQCDDALSWAADTVFSSCAVEGKWGGDAEQCRGDNHENGKTSTIPCADFENRSPFGQGGRPGVDVADFDLFGFLENLGGCMFGASQESCAQLTSDVIEVVDEALSDGVPAGQGGEGSVFGTLADGGGGGGGGHVEPFAPPPFDLGSDGGGGGAGGAGAGSLTIFTADRVLLDGALTAKGGDGGQGDVVATGPGGVEGGTPPRLRPEDNGNPGGGGGGGAGGSLEVAGARGILLGSGGSLTAVGGRGGSAAFRVIDSQTSTLLTVQYRYGSGGEGAPGREHISDPFTRAGYALIDPTTLDTQVTRRAIHEVEIHAKPGLVFGSITPLYGVALVVECEDGSQHTFVGELGRVAGPNLNRATIPVLLCAGHNEVRAVGLTGSGSIGSDVSSLFHRSVLVISGDADGDGLSDADEAAIGTDPASPDSDADGLQDADEVRRGANPLEVDSDGDGLLDGEEVHLYGSSPTSTDSDGDSFADGVEVVRGSSPVHAQSAPAGLPAGAVIAASGSSIVHLDPYSGAIGVGPALPGSFGLNIGLAFGSSFGLCATILDTLVSPDPFTGATGAATILRDQNDLPVLVAQIAAPPGGELLYGVELGPGPAFEASGQLISIQRIFPDDGLVTRRGPPLPASIHSLAFDDTGVLYAALGDGVAGDRLVTLDADSGTVLEDKGTIAVGLTPVAGLEFDGATLLGAAPALDSTTAILAIDRSTGVGTQLSTSLTRPLFDLASPIPDGTPTQSCVIPATGLTQEDLAAPGDGLVTRDHYTRLDWLDVPLTQGLSFDQVAEGAGGWYAAGWRHAAGWQICDFVGRNAVQGCNEEGRADTTDPTAVGLMTVLMNLVGDTGSGGPGDAQRNTDGVFDDGGPRGLVGEMGLRLATDPLGAPEARVRTATGERLSFEPSGAGGNWLVRPSPR